MPNNSEEYQRLHSTIPSYQTSCTKDEAVGMLMGLIAGPIQLTPLEHEPTAEDLEFEDSFSYSVLEELDGERGSVEGIYIEAKRDKLPEDVIAEKLAALKEYDNKIIKANGYLCDIDDELSKGESSALRIDKAASNLYVRITLSSLNEWTEDRYGISVLANRKFSTATQSQPTLKNENLTVSNQARQQKLLAQEEAILNEIRRLGSDPKKLPKNKSGKPGVKADVRHSLKTNPLFEGVTVFEKAWERLLKARLVVYVG